VNWGLKTKIKSLSFFFKQKIISFYYFIFLKQKIISLWNHQKAQFFFFLFSTFYIFLFSKTLKFLLSPSRSSFISAKRGTKLVLCFLFSILIQCFACCFSISYRGALKCRCCYVSWYNACFLFDKMLQPSSILDGNNSWPQLLLTSWLYSGLPDPLPLELES
jgi:hypothetical protein